MKGIDRYIQFGFRSRSSNEVSITQAPPNNKRLQRTGISVSPIDNLPLDAVVARPLKRDVGTTRIQEEKACDYQS
jgi:hypothetical protein